jgi:microcystin-dependent protein
MATPYLSEIRIVSFGFAPRGWALCNGQLLPINQNQALFALLGTQYGGDGRVNFALPNLQGRTPIHMGGGHVQGESGGEAGHMLTQAEIPSHTHTVAASSDFANSTAPAGNVLGAKSGRFGANIYTPASNLTPLHPGSVGQAGGNQPHDNMQPYLVLNFVIALQGIFPSQN